jgi:hypothetical protein
VDETQFWTIIEAAGGKRRADPDRQLAAARKRLAKLPPEEIRAFHRLFNQKLADAYTWDLWGAAYLINGGCSDDGFHYFRAWLISHGRGVYEAAVPNPDSLAGLTDPDRDDHEFEDLCYVALDAYKEVTGQDMPSVDFRWPAKPRGRRWDFDDDRQVARRLPKLAKVYLAGTDPAADRGREDGFPQ